MEGTIRIADIRTSCTSHGYDKTQSNFHRHLYVFFLTLKILKPFEIAKRHYSACKISLIDTNDSKAGCISKIKTNQSNCISDHFNIYCINTPSKFSPSEIKKMAYTKSHRFKIVYPINIR